MKKKVVFMTFLIYFCCFNIVAQNETEGVRDFNLPPGTIMKLKTSQDIIDYSYKLADIETVNNVIKSTDDFLASVVPDEDLMEMKAVAVDSYEYYIKAQMFYTNLSNKVKAVFSIDELWYIYMYDVPLTQRLITIK
jgi:hypothetical protein